uniref:Uncharacterized protein n=1 Tax=Anopheles melas TaxID=34690 RepID=A0A182TLR0_9DIPT
MAASPTSTSSGGPVGVSSSSSSSFFFSSRTCSFSSSFLAATSGVGAGCFVAGVAAASSSGTVAMTSKGGSGGTFSTFAGDGGLGGAAGDFAFSLPGGATTAFSLLRRAAAAQARTGRRLLPAVASASGAGGFGWTAGGAAGCFFAFSCCWRAVPSRGVTGSISLGCCGLARFSGVLAGLVEGVRLRMVRLTVAVRGDRPTTMLIRHGSVCFSFVLPRCCCCCPCWRRYRLTFCTISRTSASSSSSEEANSDESLSRWAATVDADAGSVATFTANAFPARSGVTGGCFMRTVHFFAVVRGDFVLMTVVPVAAPTPGTVFLALLVGLRLPACFGSGCSRFCLSSSTSAIRLRTSSWWIASRTCWSKLDRLIERMRFHSSSAPGSTLRFWADGCAGAADSSHFHPSVLDHLLLFDRSHLGVRLGQWVRIQRGRGRQHQSAGVCIGLVGKHRQAVQRGRCARLADHLRADLDVLADRDVVLLVRQRHGRAATLHHTAFVIVHHVQHHRLAVRVLPDDAWKVSRHFALAAIRDLVNKVLPVQLGGRQLHGTGQPVRFGKLVNDGIVLQLCHRLAGRVLDHEAVQPIVAYLRLRARCDVRLNASQRCGQVHAAARTPPYVGQERASLGKLFGHLRQPLFDKVI